MTSISALATHRGEHARGVGLRRAVLARQVLLGDCITLGDNARTLLSRRAWQRPACVVPLDSRRHRRPSAADLAVAVATQLLAAHPELATQRIGTLIYCHEAPDAHMSASTAGRLQHELGLTAAHPLAISQAHNTAPWIALDLALGLIEGPECAEHVLLVSSDKLVFGGPGQDARALVFRDVATAMLVSRGDARGWRVEAVALHQFDTPHDGLTAWPAAARQAFAHFGAAAVAKLLAQCAVAAAGLHAVLAVSADPALAQALHRAAGLAPARPGSAHVGATQWLLELAATAPHTPVGQIVLVWAAGNNGEFACSLLQRL